MVNEILFDISYASSSHRSAVLGSYGKDVQMEAGRCFSLFMSKAADIVAKSSEITQILQQVM